MDLSCEKGPGSTDPSSEESATELRVCADCRTTKTPLWRGGPSGPKSLCNACGIRYSKKRREVWGVKEGGEREGERERERERLEQKGRRGGRVGFEIRMLGFGAKVMLKKRSMVYKKRKMGEEEQAAVLLMALSSGLL
ncbi:GATA transcription factor 16 [Ananas comosus]|nr:GATA transcription factor 16 [Ananas comosus]